MVSEIWKGLEKSGDLKVVMASSENILILLKGKGAPFKNNNTCTNFLIEGLSDRKGGKFFPLKAPKFQMTPVALLRSMIRFWIHICKCIENWNISGKSGKSQEIQKRRIA